MSTIKTIKETNHKGVLSGEHPDLQLSLYFSSGKYWVSIMPCLLSNAQGNFECMPFDGKSETVARADRRSKATDQAAIKLFDENESKYLAMFKPISKAAQDILRPEWDAMQDYLNQPCQTEAEGAFAG